MIQCYSCGELLDIFLKIAYFSIHYFFIKLSELGWSWSTNCILEKWRKKYTTRFSQQWRNHKYISLLVTHNHLSQLIRHLHLSFCSHVGCNLLEERKGEHSITFRFIWKENVDFKAFFHLTPFAKVLKPQKVPPPVDSLLLQVSKLRRSPFFLRVCEKVKRYFHFFWKKEIRKLVQGAGFIIL